ncbi:MAG: FtsX-like permease family protein [Pseudomonadota bacterium]
MPATGWTVWLAAGAAASMGFLAILSVSVGLGAAALSESWRDDLARRATLWIAPPKATQPERMEAAATLLRDMAGIAAVEPLSDDAQAELLTPWLGEGAPLDALPVPLVADVLLHDGGPDPAQVQTRLALAVPGARYDGHGAWRAPALAAADGLGRLAWIATALISIAAGAMIGLAAKASLASHAGTLKLLRLLGGEDRHITGALVGRLTLLAAIGAFLGAVLGLAALRLLPTPLPGPDGAGSLQPSLAGGAMLAGAIALAAGAVTWATARIAASAMLRRLP